MSFSQVFFLCQTANRAGAGSSLRQRCNSKQAGSAPSTSHSLLRACVCHSERSGHYFLTEHQAHLRGGKNQGSDRGVVERRGGRNEAGVLSWPFTRLTEGDLYQPTLGWLAWANPTATGSDFLMVESRHLHFSRTTEKPLPVRSLLTLNSHGHVTVGA